ncbi:MAG: transposase [Paraglaciecola sp.]|jgi:transposase
MSGKRYTEEFKVEAVKQVTDRGYKIGEVAKRLGVTAKSMHDGIKKYDGTGSQHQTITGQQDDLRQVKAQLRRVTEERNILKEAAVYFASESKKNTRSIRQDSSNIQWRPCVEHCRFIPAGSMAGSNNPRASGPMKTSACTDRSNSLD